MTNYDLARVSTRPRRWTAFENIGPNWFACVMGTGIVANAAALLPVDVTGLHVLARGMWVLASLVLVTITAATAMHWAFHRTTALGHLDHPVMSHFYGAPAMALMTVGAGALLVGVDLVGNTAAVAVDAVLWPAGTVLGIWTLYTIPRRELLRPAPYAGPAFGGWLMPVVPPMVSAATGALLVPHLAPSARPVMVAACYLMGVAALAASAPLIMLIVRRAVRGHLGAAVTVPTMFIVLGPLGQSVTAAHALGDKAGGAGRTIGIAYGLPVLIAALVWLVVAVTVTARTARARLPFGLTWWSFTFPIGTVATGASGLAADTGSTLLAAAAVTLFVVLVMAWTVVAALTLRGVANGELLRAPQTA